MKNLFNRATLVALTFTIFAGNVNAGILDKSKETLGIFLGKVCEYKKTTIGLGVTLALVQAYRARDQCYWEDAFFKNKIYMKRKNFDYTATNFVYTAKQVFFGLINSNIVNYVFSGIKAFLVNPQYFNTVYYLHSNNVYYKKMTDMTIQDINSLNDKLQRQAKCIEILTYFSNISDNQKKSEFIKKLGLNMENNNNDNPSADLFSSKLMKLLNDVSENQKDPLSEIIENFKNIKKDETTKTSEKETSSSEEEISSSEVLEDETTEKNKEE